MLMQVNLTQKKYHTTVGIDFSATIRQCPKHKSFRDANRHCIEHQISMKAEIFLNQSLTIHMLPICVNKHMAQSLYRSTNIIQNFILQNLRG
jgi:hypothetical protein